MHNNNNIPIFFSETKFKQRKVTYDYGKINEVTVMDIRNSWLITVESWMISEILYICIFWIILFNFCLFDSSLFQTMIICMSSVVSVCLNLSYFLFALVFIIFDLFLFEDVFISECVTCKPYMHMGTCNVQGINTETNV